MTVTAERFRCSALGEARNRGLRLLRKLLCQFGTRVKASDEPAEVAEVMTTRAENTVCGSFDLN